MTKRAKEYIKEKIPYYGKISRKNRYSDQLKDKAWTILSDYVRCRDFLSYGTCVATGSKINHWRDSDAGHYESMSGHGALLGFSDMNVHAQSAISNFLSSMADGARFKEELVRRYGEEYVKNIEIMKHQTVKADDWFFIGKIEEFHEKFLNLKNHYELDYPLYV